MSTGTADYTYWLLICQVIGRYFPPEPRL